MSESNNSSLNYRDLELTDQDRWLPIANVARLMKNTLPSTSKVSKDAKECMQECVSEFISFVTSEASDRCLNEKRKTINGEDILYSMHSLGFENYAEVLKIYLAKYREQQALRQDRGEISTKKKSSSKKLQDAVEGESDENDQEDDGASKPDGVLSEANDVIEDYLNEGIKPEGEAESKISLETDQNTLHNTEPIQEEALDQHQQEERKEVTELASNKVSPSNNEGLNEADDIYHQGAGNVEENMLYEYGDSF